MAAYRPDGALRWPRTLGDLSIGVGNASPKDIARCSATAGSRIESDRLYAMYLLIVMAGLRRGEAVGLRWSDVELDEQVIAVRQQVVAVRREVRIGPPKTQAGERLVALDATTAAALRAHRRRQLQERLAWGEAWTSTGLVFTHADGLMLRPDFVTHHFRYLAKGADLPVIRLHDLRHTSASLALAAKVPLKVVSDRLGHSSTSITADLYSHLLPVVAAEAAEQIAQLVPRARPEGDVTAM